MGYAAQIISTCRWGLIIKRSTEELRYSVLSTDLTFNRDSPRNLPSTGAILRVNNPILPILTLLPSLNLIFLVSDRDDSLCTPRTNVDSDIRMASHSQ